MTYSAANIKIEEDPQFDYLKIRELSEKYNRPEVFVKRGFEACRLARVDPSYFIQRYLDGDRSIPVNQDVADISRELQKSEN